MLRVVVGSLSSNSLPPHCQMSKVAQRQSRRCVKLATFFLLVERLLSLHRLAGARQRANNRQDSQIELLCRQAEQVFIELTSNWRLQTNNNFPITFLFPPRRYTIFVFPDATFIDLIFPQFS